MRTCGPTPGSTVRLVTVRAVFYPRPPLPLLVQTTPMPKQYWALVLFALWILAVHFSIGPIVCYYSPEPLPESPGTLEGVPTIPNGVLGNPEGQRWCFTNGR